MKTQMTLTVDSHIKESFQKIAKKMGANMSTLANMYFTQVVNTGKVEFYLEDEQKVDIGFIPYNNLSKTEQKEINKLKEDPLNNFINI